MTHVGYNDEPLTPLARTIVPSWQVVESDNIEAIGTLNVYVMCEFGGKAELPEPEMLPFARVPVSGEWILHRDEWWSVYRVLWADGKAKLILSYVS